MKASVVDSARWRLSESASRSSTGRCVAARGYGDAEIQIVPQGRVVGSLSATKVS